MKPILNNLKRASVDMMLLALLVDENKYCYQMAQEIKQRSDGRITLVEASMYPIISRLIANKEVEVADKKQINNLVRVYYRITDTGREHLEFYRKEFRELTALINEICTPIEEITYE